MSILSKIPKQNRAAVETVVGEGSRLEGTIVVEDGIRVDGLLTGKLEVGGSLRIGRSGEVAANIQCKRDVVVAGRVEGDLRCDGELRLEASAIVIGDVAAGVMVVEEGAVLKGLISVGPEDVADAETVENPVRQAASG